MRDRIQLALITSAVLAATAAAAGGLAPAASARTQALRGTVLPGLRDVASSRAVNPSQRMQLTIALDGRDAAGLQQAKRDVYTRSSSSYHHFLTPAQIGRRFGAPAARWSGAKRWLRAGGLKVVSTPVTRDVLVVSGTAAQVQRRFGVTLRSFAQSGQRFVANTDPPHVPSGLGVRSVLGLNTLQHAEPTTQTTHRRALSKLLKPASSLLSGTLAGLGGVNIGEQTPQDILGSYEAPPTGTDTGSGQSVAVLGAGATDQVITDLNTFTDQHGQRRVPVDVTHVGDGPFDDTSGLAEWNIDTQAAAGMAPGLDREQLYFAKDLSDASVAAIFSSWISDPDGPKQANASFGECIEQPLGDAIDNLPVIGDLLSSPALPAGTGLINKLQPVAEDLLAKATLEGRTLFASSGDTGSSCPVVFLPVIGAGNGLLNQVVPFVNYPSASPSATSVGGTVLYTKGGDPPSRALEYGWTFGGGGNSLFLPEPAYQQGIQGAGDSQPCLATSDGKLTNTGKPCRTLPDVSAMSGDVLTNNYPTISGGKTSPGGGTSLSSPLWAGMWARVQGHAGVDGLGFANQTLYRLAKDPATRDRDFHDITQGLLGLPLVGNGLYLTTKGYDDVTGLGTPSLANLIHDAPAAGG